MCGTLMQALVIVSSLSIVAALPFMDSQIGLSKVPDTDLSSGRNQDSSDDYGNYLPPDIADTKWLYPLNDMNNLFSPNSDENGFVSRHDETVDVDNDENGLDDIPMQSLSKRASMNRFYGVRGKRLSFAYYPFGFLRQYRSGRRRRLYPTMFVASRGKRQDVKDIDSDEKETDTSPYTFFDSPNPMLKRRRFGFTALRGR